MVEEDKSWPVRVARQSDALDLEEGVFAWKGPRCIALAQQRSAEATRHLHPLWQSFYRHGTGHQCGCRYAGQDQRALPPGSKGKDRQDKPADDAATDASKQKIVNDAVAYLRRLAELCGPQTRSGRKKPCERYPMLIFLADFLVVSSVSEDVDSTIVGFVGVNDAF